MKITVKSVLFLVITTFLFSCSTPKGDSLQAQRNYVDQMRNETLAELYAEKPVAKWKIEKAAGYAVFSSINTNLFLFSSASGYGVCTKNAIGQQIYMKMYQFGVGPGLGVKDYRAVFIFYDKATLNKFVEEGWEFGGQADAAAKSAGKGDAIGAQASFEKNLEIYTLTESGVALQATIAGTRYVKDAALN